MPIRTLLLYQRQSKLCGLGMRFIGAVKTASEQFPMAYLHALEFDRRGEMERIEERYNVLECTPLFLG